MKTKNIVLIGLGVLIVSLLAYVLLRPADQGTDENEDLPPNDEEEEQEGGIAPPPSGPVYLTDEQVEINGQMLNCLDIQDGLFARWTTNTNIYNWFESLRDFGLDLNKCENVSNHYCRFGDYPDWTDDAKRAFTFYRLVDVAPTRDNNAYFADYLVDWVENGPDWEYTEVPRGALRCGTPGGFFNNLIFRLF